MPKRQVDIFSSPARAWIAVGTYTALLYATPGLTLRLYMWVFERIGAGGVGLSLIILFVVLALAVIVFARPRRLSAWAALAASALVMAYVFRLTTVPANRIHFLQYAPLTLLIYDAFKFRVLGRERYLWTLLATSAVGFGDEVFQSLVDRRFDLNDIALNALAATLTLGLIGYVWERESKDADHQDGGTAKGE